MRRRWAAAFRTALPSALCGVTPAWAQAKNPFSVGISEGGGGATGITGWLLAQQGWFEHQLSATVRAAKADGTALWMLVGLSLVYGVFHAAGPGHGKAVLASYMVANERALRRGVVLSFLAALLQGVVAITLVGSLAIVFHATAQRMKDAAALAETASFAGIALLGAWLVWRKGRAFLSLCRTPATPLAFETAPRLASFGATASLLAGPSQRLAVPAASSTRFICIAADEQHGEGCAHCLPADPSRLGEAAFSWREAALTVAAAGARPCSGAILVLVFALTQGLFAAGVASVFAMSLGVAVTTAALASIAVLAKGVARRLTRPGSRAGLLLLAGLELTAAALVLCAGAGLLFGYAAGAA